MNQTNISARLRGQLDQLSGAPKRIATAILQDPAGRSNLPIAKLAELAQTSQSSVNRFCKSLGLPGYPDLKLALAAEHAVTNQPVQPEGDIAEGDDLTSVVRKITALDAQAVQDTASLLDIDVLERAIAALAGARRTDVYGVGASAVVGVDFVQKMTRIGRIAVHYGDAHLGLTSAALLGQGDVAIAISHSGSTQDTLDMTRTAAAGGATTIAVTNNPGSPLAAEADLTLLTAARESVFRSGATASRLAQLVVIDCIFVGLAQRTFSASQQALEATLRAVHDRPTRPPGRVHP
jgi:DNA-binding MurR/RpiR family transcriptional regulator